MDTNDLAKSRWAPFSTQNTAPPRPSLRRISLSNPNLSQLASSPDRVARRHASRVQHFQTFQQLLRRLKWRSTSLLYSHHRAETCHTDNIICGANFFITSDDGRANAAETMFKLDFFEYYALLERVLLHLLACYDIVISAEHASEIPLPQMHNYTERAPSKDTLIGDSQTFHGSQHRFHANLLLAFDNPKTALHPIFGIGTTREYLGIAKEFRNRWKEADQMSAGQEDISDLHRRYRRIVADLELDKMLMTILTALDQARSIAAEHISSLGNADDIAMAISVDDAADVMIEDAMEWD